MGKSAINFFVIIQCYVDKYHPWVNAEYLLETYKIGLLKK